ncbi:MAG: DUF3783 domain-containing protein [Clostridiales bacterium]|nr:DUF3783 domain-containing protein [Candidatus Crickella merdequi]
MKKCYIYNLNEDKNQRLQPILKALGIPCAVLTDADLTRTIEDIITDALAEPPCTVDDLITDEDIPHSEMEFMLMNELTDTELDAFLAAMREAGISLPYKAIVTPSNRDFILGNLLSHILKEREAVLRQMSKKTNINKNKRSKGKRKKRK